MKKILFVLSIIFLCGMTTNAQTYVKSEKTSATLGGYEFNIGDLVYLGFRTDDFRYCNMKGRDCTSNDKGYYKVDHFVTDTSSMKTIALAVPYMNNRIKDTLVFGNTAVLYNEVFPYKPIPKYSAYGIQGDYQTKTQTTQARPSYYLDLAYRRRCASIGIAVGSSAVGGAIIGIGYGVGSNGAIIAGGVIAGVGGLISFIYYCCAVHNDGLAAKSFSRIKVNSNGVNVEF